MQAARVAPLMRVQKVVKLLFIGIIFLREGKKTFVIG
jgi:hypothetical protein